MHVLNYSKISSYFASRTSARIQIVRTTGLHSGMPFLGALRAAFGVSSESVPAECADCDLKCASASVTPHDYHILVRLPREPEVAAATGPTWWPDTLGDRLAPFEGILDEKKRIKATAFEYPDEMPREFQHEAYVFARNRSASKNHLVATGAAELVELVRREILSMESRGTTNGDANKNGRKTYIVCAHMARDARCGQRGPGIAKALASASPGDTVLLSSHVGGHVYAGNLIVYGGGVASGTWFGGVHERNVPKLLAGIKDAELRGVDPAQSEDLRPYWRGTSGRSKDEQAQFFAASRDIEDSIRFID